MSDSHDPFAAQPYRPPHERGEEPEATTDLTPSAPMPPAPPAPPAAPGPDAAAADEIADPITADHEPTIQQPYGQQPPGPQAGYEPTVVQPVISSEPPRPPEPEPEPAVVQPIADEQIHRFGADLPPASTTPLPPHDLPRDDAPDSGGAAVPPPFVPTPTPSGGSPKPPRRRGRGLAKALAIIVLAAAAGFGGAAGYEALNKDSDQPVVSSLKGSSSGDTLPEGAVEKVAAAVLPSVVQINVKGASASGSGSGIIISSDGDILTNNHVVEAAGNNGTVTVAFSDGTNVSATVVGTDPLTDLAVIKAKDQSDLTPATLGNSKDLQVGQEVVAIGSPFGLESTVTSGIVSALNRPVSSSDGSGTSRPTTFPAVQTDAAINPGNSGGPLVDLEGRVIAINSAIRSSGTPDSGSIGLGFAIPIDLAKSVSEHLVKGEKVEHARIGVIVEAATGSDGITGIGARIKEVTANGAGDKAGLKAGDVITAVDGHPVSSQDGLVAAIRAYRPGEKVELTYLRDGKPSTVTVTLDSDGGELSN